MDKQGDSFDVLQLLFAHQTKQENNIDSSFNPLYYIR